MTLIVERRKRVVIHNSASLTDGKTLKMLCLTSSFGLNTTELLYDVAMAEGYEDVIVARLYASGCTLKKHVDAFNTDTGIYWYTKFTKDGKYVTPEIFEQRLANF